VESAVSKPKAGLSMTTATSLTALRDPPLENLVRAKSAKTTVSSGK